MNELEVKLAELSKLQQEVRKMEIEIEVKLVTIDRLLGEVDNLREQTMTTRRGGVRWRSSN